MGWSAVLVGVSVLVVWTGRMNDDKDDRVDAGNVAYLDVGLGSVDSILALDRGMGWASSVALPAPVPVGAPELPPAGEPEDGGATYQTAKVEPRTAIEVLIAGYPWDARRMTRVMYCESGGRPDAISPGGHRGLFQLATGWAAGNPEYWTRWMEPEYNIALAYYVWTKQGYGAWSCR